MILPISGGSILVARILDGKLCIKDTSLRNYMKKYIKPISKNKSHVDAKPVYAQCYFNQILINGGYHK